MAIESQGIIRASTTDHSLSSFDQQLWGNVQERNEAIQVFLWLRQCHKLHKPSPSHHHSQMGGLLYIWFYPHYFRSTIFWDLMCWWILMVERFVVIRGDSWLGSFGQCLTALGPWALPTGSQPHFGIFMVLFKVFGYGYGFLMDFWWIIWVLARTICALPRTVALDLVDNFYHRQVPLWQMWFQSL